jgi:UV DNA damage endonuclease
MNNHQFGYACINLSLQPQGVTTTRSLILKTFNAKGLQYVGELALANLQDLKRVIEWNIANGFTIFRVTSDIFPWWSKYKLTDLPNFPQLEKLLREIGDLCRLHKQRLSFHPDHFTKMGSSDPMVVANSLWDIEQHSLVFDLMGFDPSPYNKVNIHIGGAYGNKQDTMLQFCTNFTKLSANARMRLTIENDDKAAMYSVRDLYDGVFTFTNIPIVFDYHHHSIHPDGLTEQEAFELAYSTWRIPPVFHYSESGMNGIRSHSDYVKGPISTYGKDCFVMIEAKAKDLAVLSLLKNAKK